MGAAGRVDDAARAGDALRRPAAALEAFATELFAAAGMEHAKAAAIARLLVLTDMMGRRTHGLAQCAAYLREIEQGGMARSGEPEVVRDTGATIVWDGGYLPGIWLVDQALAVGFERVARHGIVAIAIRRSHHIGCLAALAKAAADRGLFVLLASSGPHTFAVAPHGGREPLFSPNPFAIGYPTGSAPVLVDICASLTTISMTREKAAAGEHFAHPWLLDHAGVPTTDPAVIERAEKRGSLLLLGGQEAGHKGFGLALMVEALTQGLAGFGRLDRPTRWGANVYLQLIDPAAFAGADAFTAQTGFFAAQCRASAPLDPAAPVRLPGEQADRNIAGARRNGVPVSAATAAALAGWAARLGVGATVLD
jgi:LDH2 family malate/lactate/ureidoglycolate dehydrogenase